MKNYGLKSSERDRFCSSKFNDFLSYSSGCVPAESEMEELCKLRAKYIDSRQQVSSFILLQLDSGRIHFEAPIWRLH